MQLVKLKNYFNEQVRYVTCSQCCKCYVAPETAGCGHSLCHTCWIGRKTCPLCTKQLDHRTLKFNKPLQIRTENIHNLNDAFAQYFNIKSDEPVFEGTEIHEKDKKQNVDGWLANSQNDFSAPLSQKSDIMFSENKNNENIITTEVQIHNSNEVTTIPIKQVHKRVQQHDWDAIEDMKDEDDEKEKENIIGPKDFEPFSLDDKEYSIEQPRRSSRKRKAKNMDIENDKSMNDIEKINNVYENPNLQKIKKCWNTVKRMRKDFNKNMTKNNKLDVSIENSRSMQNIGSKCSNQSTISLLNVNGKEDLNQYTQVVEKVNKPCVLTDNNGQEMVQQTSKVNRSINENSINNLSTDIGQPNSGIRDANEHDIIIENIEGTQSNIKDDSSKNEQEISESLSKEKSDKTLSTATLPTEICLNSPSLSDNNEKDKSIRNSYNTKSNVKDCILHKESNTEKTMVMPSKMQFIKKSALCPTQKVNNLQSKLKHFSVPQTTEKDSDDIEISIKTGNTVTNIVIKRKENDIHFKVMADKSVQTSSQCEDRNKVINAEFTLKNISGQNIDLNVGNIQNNVVQIKSQNIANPNEINLKSESTSTKKHTSSATTQTLDVIITESLERELANPIECSKELAHEEVKNALSVQENVLRSGDLPQPLQVGMNSNKNILKKKDLTQSIEMPQPVHDIDIFDTEQVKETEVVALSHAPSEILMPTLGSRKFREEKIKRKERETDSKDLSSQNKKAKVISDIEEEEKQSKIDDNILPDSESIHYDSLMSQVFAKIDEDIRTIRKPSDNESENKLSKLALNKSKKSKDDSQKQDVFSSGQLKETTMTTQKEEIIVPSLDVDKQNLDDPHNLEVSLSIHRIEQLTPCTVKSTQKSRKGNTKAAIEKGIHDNDDSDRSIVEETPEKNISFPRTKQKSNTKVKESNANTTEKFTDKQNVITVINLEDSSANNIQNTTVIDKTLRKLSLETPLSIDKFVGSITHNSTPVARKSLNFDSENIEDQTLCPTVDTVKNTQEKEFMMRAFECSPLNVTKVPRKEKKQYCLAGSCLTMAELAKLKMLCKEHNWTFVDKYTKDITHLVVSVDSENLSQRSVKYMCALADSKWIISYAWVEKCLAQKRILNVEFFEVLDSTGHPGPMRSRTAKRKLFAGFKFFCMPPFSILGINTLQDMLISSGGQIVNRMQQVQVTENNNQPALLLAEPENTQENQFTYLAMEHSIVPVNYEWVLNSLGAYVLEPINELLLCPSSLLPKATSRWPEGLLASDNTLTN